jgi:hypothetical protein
MVTKEGLKESCEAVKRCSKGIPKSIYGHKRGIKGVRVVKRSKDARKEYQSLFMVTKEGLKE